MRLNAGSTVVGPLREEPMKAVISFSYMDIETSVTALKALYQIETFCTSKIVGPGARSPLCWAASGLGRGRLVTVSSGCSMTFLARVSGEPGGDDTGDDHEDKRYGDEGERRAPGAGLRAHTRRCRGREDQKGQPVVGTTEHAPVHSGRPPQHSADQ